MAPEGLEVSAEAMHSFSGACVEEGEGWGAAEGEPRVQMGLSAGPRVYHREPWTESYRRKESPSESAACQPGPKAQLSLHQLSH